MSYFTRPLTALVGLGILASAAGAQQELFVLGRFNKIWRVDGYDTATPVLVEITTWQNNGQMDPVGLERDPATGDFLLLTSPWLPGGAGGDYTVRSRSRYWRLRRSGGIGLRP